MIVIIIIIDIIIILQQLQWQPDKNLLVLYLTAFNFILPPQNSKHDIYVDIRLYMLTMMTKFSLNFCDFHVYVYTVRIPNKHLLVFLAPNIIFIGQMEKDIGRDISRVKYLSTADQ